MEPMALIVSPLLAATASLHDPRTGFHDIKPLPEFHPAAIPQWSAWLALLLPAALLLLAWRRRRKAKTAQRQGESPVAAALRQLAELERTRLDNPSPRAIAEEASLILRRYLEKRIGIPAVERTAREVLRSLPEPLRRKLPRSSKEQRAALLEPLSETLLLCEKVIFMEESERLFPTAGDDMARLLSGERLCIERIEQVLVKEEERSRGVMTESRLEAAQT